MDVEILVEKSEHIEFIMKNTRHTLPNLLRETLLSDPKVEFVSYALNHPLGKDAKFILKTKGKTAKKALTEAFSSIEEELSEFKKNVKKTLM